MRLCPVAGVGGMGGPGALDSRLMRPKQGGWCPHDTACSPALGLLTLCRTLVAVYKIGILESSCGWSLREAVDIRTKSCLFVQLLFIFGICSTLYISTPAPHHCVSKPAGTMEPALSSF